MINEIKKTIETFDVITLVEMDSVKLMDRIDTKYNFNIKSLALFLQQIKSEYFVLHVENEAFSNYKTLYYDTNDRKLYHEHHQGKLNRYKIRHRLYLQSNIGFLEVKHKTNKGRTIKKRIAKNDILNTWDSDAETFLTKQLPFDFKSLRPEVWINYTRITLVNKKLTERVTLDLNLTFDMNGLQQINEKLVIAEVKQDGKFKSIFETLMKANNIAEGGLSKYCTAVAVMNKSIKKNNFKEKILRIKKIQLL